MVYRACDRYNEALRRQSRVPGGDCSVCTKSAPDTIHSETVCRPLGLQHYIIAISSHIHPPPVNCPTFWPDVTLYSCTLAGIILSVRTQLATHLQSSMHMVFQSHERGEDLECPVNVPQTNSTEGDECPTILYEPLLPLKGTGDPHPSPNCSFEL